MHTIIRRRVDRTVVASLPTIVLLFFFLAGRAAASDAPGSLDLAAFAPWSEGNTVVNGSETLVAAHTDPALALLPPTTSVAREMTVPAVQRFYVTSIVGGSFFVVTADNTPSPSLTAGGALGVAVERENGRIRLEVEGRYRDFVEQTYLGFNENYSALDPTAVGTMQARTYGGWSALANVWRDFRFTDHVDLYAGGGIGAAGFQTEFQRIDATNPAPRTDRYITGYAWQVGVGGIWNLSDRVAIDASYRIFGVGWTITREDVAFGFLRSEILLSLRIYEPFRGLLR
jgi:opacity protein-like surface antigen